MKYKKFLYLLLITVIITAIPSFAKQPKNKYQFGVYIAGVSASFSDSLIYFTNVQFVDSAAINDKKLLEGRAQYSIQLKRYLETKQNGHNRTCFIYYNTKKNKLEKEISKIKEKYRKGKMSIILDVNPEFTFKRAELY